MARTTSHSIRRALSHLLTLCSVLICGSTFAVSLDYVPDRILLKPRPAAPEHAVQAMIGQQGAYQAGEIPKVGIRMLKVPADRLKSALAGLSRNPNVEFVQLDYRIPIAMTPTDPFFCYQWHLTNTCASTAWEVTAGDPNVVVAVLDTGVESTHPDLASKLVAGWNTYDNNPNTADVLGHGTAVAGVAGALANNAIGVASVAPNCMLMPIRISDAQGYGYDSTVANGLVWAADHGARVANISYEFSGSATVRTAADYFRSKGGVVIMAAGNSGQTLTYADNPSVLTVSATGSSGALASWSNKGAVIDVAAPGLGIYTTYKAASFNSLSGTSFAAPCVAGVAALVISVNPQLTAQQVDMIIKSSADDLGAAGWDPGYGWGRVNAEKAVRLALNTLAATDTAVPVVTVTSPAAGAVVTGVVGVHISAVDNVGVAAVNLVVDGQTVGSSTVAPFSFNLDTRYLSEGTHTLAASASDKSGNVGFSSPITIQVRNGGADVAPPLVQIVSPSTTISVTKTLSVSVSATDNVNVARVDLLVDGKLASTSTSANPVFTLNTAKLSKGSHTLQACAYDAAHNCGKSAPVTIRK